MGLFDKKYCAICGQKIGLFGNRKLEDGNMCKDCADKMSPWLTGRREYTVAEMNYHLNYRAQNWDVLHQMTISDVLGGDNYRFYFDRTNQLWFTSNRDNNYISQNPDVFSFSMVTGCSTEIREDRRELHWHDQEDHIKSYEPREYVYSYNFFITVYLQNFIEPSITMRLNDISVEGAYCAAYKTFEGELANLQYVFETMASGAPVAIPAPVVYSAGDMRIMDDQQQWYNEQQRQRMERFERHMMRPEPVPMAPVPPIQPARPAAPHSAPAPRQPATPGPQGGRTATPAQTAPRQPAAPGPQGGRPAASATPHQSAAPGPQGGRPTTPAQPGRPPQTAQTGKPAPAATQRDNHVGWASTPAKPAQNHPAQSNRPEPTAKPSASPQPGSGSQGSSHSGGPGSQGGRGPGRR